jgi:23S rRNA (adenine1618-N6)-methyltransferase
LNIPEGYLCPPISSRADYFITPTTKERGKIKICKGLDIELALNCIYPILQSQLFN